MSLNGQLTRLTILAQPCQNVMIRRISLDVQIEKWNMHGYNGSEHLNLVVDHYGVARHVNIAQAVLKVLTKCALYPSIEKNWSNG